MIPWWLQLALFTGAAFIGGCRLGRWSVTGSRGMWQGICLYRDMDCYSDQCCRRQSREGTSAK